HLPHAPIGEPHCPRTGEITPSRTSSQILEAILYLPEGTEIELRAPVFKQYGEELDFVLTEVRKKGKAIKAGSAATLLVGDALMQVQVTKSANKKQIETFYAGLCSKTHRF